MQNIKVEVKLMENVEEYLNKYSEYKKILK